MSRNRFALQIRIGEMMEFLDGIRGQGLANVVASGGMTGLINYDIDVIYYALDDLGEKVSEKGFPLPLLENEYEAIRKNLLSLVSRLAQITICMTGPHTVADAYQHAICM